MSSAPGNLQIYVSNPITILSNKILELEIQNTQTQDPVVIDPLLGEAGFLELLLRGHFNLVLLGTLVISTAVSIASSALVENGTLQIQLGQNALLHITDGGVFNQSTPMRFVIKELAGHTSGSGPMMRITRTVAFSPAFNVGTLELSNIYLDIETSVVTDQRAFQCVLHLTDCTITTNCEGEGAPVLGYMSAAGSYFRGCVLFDSSALPCLLANNLNDALFEDCKFIGSATLSTILLHGSITGCYFDSLRCGPSAVAGGNDTWTSSEITSSCVLTSTAGGTQLSLSGIRFVGSYVDSNDLQIISGPTSFTACELRFDGTTSLNGCLISNCLLSTSSPITLTSSNKITNCQTDLRDIVVSGANNLISSCNLSATSLTLDGDTNAVAGCTIGLNDNPGLIINGDNNLLSNSQPISTTFRVEIAATANQTRVIGNHLSAALVDGGTLTVDLGNTV